MDSQNGLACKSYLVQHLFNELGHFQLDWVSQESHATWPWKVPGTGHLTPLWAISFQCLLETMKTFLVLKFTGFAIPLVHSLRGPFWISPCTQMEGAAGSGLLSLTLTLCKSPSPIKYLHASSTKLCGEWKQSTWQRERRWPPKWRIKVLMLHFQQ